MQANTRKCRRLASGRNANLGNPHCQLGLRLGGEFCDLARNESILGTGRGLSLGGGKKDRTSSGDHGGKRQGGVETKMRRFFGSLFGSGFGSGQRPLFASDELTLIAPGPTRCDEEHRKKTFSQKPKFERLTPFLE